jgi:hypothetical protein
MTIDLPQLSVFERKHISLAIEKRKRYRFVRPTVRMLPDGILVESPCCSGGLIPPAEWWTLPCCPVATLAVRRLAALLQRSLHS